MAEIEETDPVDQDYEEINLSRLKGWYQEATDRIEDKCGLKFPKFPKKLREGTTIFNKILNIEHAFGETYYPCGGSDTKTITDLFEDYSSHITLSTTNFGHSFIEHIGNVNFDRTNVKPTIKNGYTEYQQDGIVTLLTEINDLAIFFHRQDSPGEGGSNQLWKREVLFPLVLSKIQNNGLIVTDGSLCGYVDDFDEYLPWNALCGMKPFQKPKVGDNFHWYNFDFNCVAGPYQRFPNGRPTTYIWQVNNLY